MRMVDDCRYHLVAAGISMPDAEQLRRIAMTLHRWHELECGDGNEHGSWVIVRGDKVKRVFQRDPETQAGEWVGGEFIYADDGKPWLEYHHYLHGKGKDYVSHILLNDRERGAKKRLVSIMARYPGFQAYVQGDPRGCALYILRPGDVREGEDVSSVYSRGVAVHK